MVVNTTNEKISILKDIINLVKDIRCLLSHINDSRLKYYNKNINRETDAIAKMLIFNDTLYLCFLVMKNFFSFLVLFKKKKRMLFEFCLFLLVPCLDPTPCHPLSLALHSFTT